MASNTISTLYPSFVGSATVLNDGLSPNVLTVALTNANLYEGTDAARDIQINSEDGLAFYFIADDASTSGARQHDGHKFVLNWALTSLDQMSQIQAHFYLPGETVDYKHLRQGSPSGWTITVDQPNVEGVGKLSTLYGWKLLPSVPFTLKPGQSLLLILSNIICNLPDGPSIAYMNYQEKHFEQCGPVQKTPNIISGDKVGIGTVDPQFPLSIETNEWGPKISLWDGEKRGPYDGLSISEGQMNYHVDRAVIDHVFYAGGDGTINDLGKELVRISGSGMFKVHNDKQGIELGASVAGKQIDAGKIVYQRFGNFDSLDIVGAGNNIAERKVSIYAEGGLYLSGFVNISSDGTTQDPNISPLSITETTYGPKISLWDGGEKGAYNGLSISNNQMNYHVNGNQVDHVFYAGGDGTINNLGKELVRVSGGGMLKIHGDHQGIELGAGVGDKEVNAGKILYQGFGNFDSLDIVGAGKLNNRKVTIYAEGGMNLNGPLRQNGDPYMIKKECVVTNTTGNDGYTSYDTQILWSKYIAIVGGVDILDLNVDENGAKDYYLELAKGSGGDDATWKLLVQAPFESDSGTFTVTVVAFHRSFF